MDEADQLASIMAGYVTTKRICQGLGRHRAHHCEMASLPRGSATRRIRSQGLLPVRVGKGLVGGLRASAGAGQSRRAIASVAQVRIRMSKELNKGREAPE
jgi:hypothetical protein